MAGFAKFFKKLIIKHTKFVSFNPMTFKRSTLNKIASVSTLVLISILVGKFYVSSSNMPEFNYGEALQKSIFFYEEQRSGKLDESNLINWRGDSGVSDGQDNGVDLIGGWYDAGDNIKFTFPMASSVTLLSWGVLEFKDSYIKSGQYDNVLKNIKWATDYLIKAHPSPNELYVQVGQGNIDHNHWSPVEVSEEVYGSTKSFKITESCPGSDVAAETAAALAASYLIFKDVDEEYSKILLDHALQLYSFADTFKGKYSDCIVKENFDNIYYKSWSGYKDELAWGAAWLYKATGNIKYLQNAQSYHEGNLYKYNFTHSWDDKSYGTHVLLAQLTENKKYKTATEKWLNYWTVGYAGKRISYTSGGLAWLMDWGALRFAANTSFIALIYSDWLTRGGDLSDKSNIYKSFAINQINYILGNNPQSRSYIVGFGNNSPVNVHHRTAHGSWEGNGQVPESNRHIIYGALVGGPNINDEYTDNRSDYVRNEVATDYNAGLVGALARLYQEFGGEPLENFPNTEKPEKEFLVESNVLDKGENFITIETYLNNRTAWPARKADNLSYDYLITSTDPNTEYSHIEKVEGDCNILSRNPQKISNNTYSINIDCNGVSTYPGNSNSYRIKNTFRISYINPGNLALSNADSTPVYVNGIIAPDHVEPTITESENIIPAISPIPTPVSTDDTLETISLVYNITVATQKTYKLSTLNPDNKIYIDREFELKEIPEEYIGALSILTSNKDKNETSTEFLKFNLSANSLVYVAFEDDAEYIPNWLQSWEKTKKVIKATNSDFNIYRKTLNSGGVILGASSSFPADGVHNSYFVFFDSY